MTPPSQPFDPAIDPTIDPGLDIFATPYAPTDRRHPRIICAALRARDGTLLLGLRHYSRDMTRQMEQRDDGGKFVSRTGEDQGFADQFGRYYTRREAWVIAQRTNQILHPDNAGRDLNGAPLLHSECLY